MEQCHFANCPPWYSAIHPAELIPLHAGPRDGPLLFLVLRRMGLGEGGGRRQQQFLPESRGIGSWVECYPHRLLIRWRQCALVRL